MKAAQLGVAILLAAIGFAVANGLRRDGEGAVPDVAAAVTPPIAAMEHRAPVAKRRLAIAFMLDPELTHGMFMGDRWVSPPTYFFAQDGSRFVVQAKAQSIDSRGHHIDLKGDWSVDPSDMITVAPREHGEVTIVVSRAGEGRINVATGDGSKVLQVHARQVDNAMQVRITQ